MSIEDGISEGLGTEQAKESDEQSGLVSVERAAEELGIDPRSVRRLAIR